MTAPQTERPPATAPAGRPAPAREEAPALSREELAAELAACSADPVYFIHRYVWIKGDSEWEPFRLWPAQVAALDVILRERKTAALKARQVGLTWLLLGLALWMATFRPGATILLISLREEDAIPLVDERLRGMWSRLPEWLRVPAPPDGSKRWRWSNGSTFRALPSNRGDSYTATLAVVDEADLIPRLDRLLGSLEPTINDGGQVCLISRADKRRPQSTFKRLCREGLSGDAEATWRCVFVPWHARPSRDAAWYEAQRRASLAVDGTLDTLHEQYPATPEEALSPASANRRLPPAWLALVTRGRAALRAHGGPALPGLRVYEAPQPGRRYLLGVDCAEGLATSDDSSVTVVERGTGRQVAQLSGKLDPSHALPAAVTALSRWYGGQAGAAPCLVERNNHGHATIGALQREGAVPLVRGPDGRAGYSKTPATRAQLWDEVAGRLRALWGEAEAAREAGAGYAAPELVADAQTHAQLASLEAGICKAPDDGPDDDADAWGLAQWGDLNWRDQRVSRAAAL